MITPTVRTQATSVIILFWEAELLSARKTYQTQESFGDGRSNHRSLQHIEAGRLMIVTSPSNVSIKHQERVKTTTPLAGMTTLAE
jgi:hypothetical protein